MSKSVISVKGGSKSKKSKKGHLRSTTIRKADNGYTVHKDYEPAMDPKGGYSFPPEEQPSVFSGDNAMQDAHDFSAQLHGGNDQDEDDQQGQQQQ